VSRARADANDGAASVGLDLQGPSWLQRCLTRPELESGVHARASGPLPNALRVRVTASGDDEATTQWIAIEVGAERGELGSRELEVHAADCAALPNAVAIVVVLLAQSAEPAATLPPPDTPPEPRDRSPPKPAAFGAEPEPYWRAAVGAGVGLALELLPASAASVHVRGELNLWDAAVAVLQAEVPLPQTLYIEEGAVSFAAYALSADLCAGSRDRGTSAITLRGCAGPAVALLQARGSGFRLDNRNEIKPMLAIAAHAEAAAAVAPYSRIVLQGGGGIAALRPRFLLHHADRSLHPVHTPGLFYATLGVGFVQMF
jgi:hypothetical protein